MLTTPEVAMVAATRGMLGFGAGLIASEHIGRARTKLGFVLLAIGILSTIPIAFNILRGR
ncbi:MAG TPA: hypothetical protein VL463_16480 [Kofleriaceae bacterium]|nr:hypothetical protein [Kofleriaceae bacterium]